MAFAVKKNTVIEIISGLFILLFLYTALSKLHGFLYFRFVIGQSPLIGPFAPILAWTVPVVEILISLALMIPKTKLAGLYASFITMILFTLYIGYMLAFESKLPCSCGGVIGQMTWPQHLVFNIVFTALAYLGIRLYKQNQRPPGQITNSLALS